MIWLYAIQAYLLVGAGFASYQYWRSRDMSMQRMEWMPFVQWTLMGVPVMACMAVSRGLRALLELPPR